MLTYIYVPTLHLELMPDLPKEIKPLWPGLPHMPGGYASLKLPYTSQEAKAVLNDLVELQEDALSGLAWQYHTYLASVKPSAEELDLASFAQGGQSSPVPDLTKLAHRLLLLAWLQEERILDMQHLRLQYLTHARHLAESLSGEDNNFKESFPEDSSLLLPAWQFMLELMDTLTSPEVVWCTSDSRLTRVLQKLPAQESIWPGSTVHELKLAGFKQTGSRKIITFN